MATVRAMIERRRFTRVLIRIPVRILGAGAHGEPLDAPAEAIAVSHNGALLRAAFSPALGSRIEVLNVRSQEIREFRVIRVSRSAADASFELGVEILHPARSFWGASLPENSRA
ncbi:MAG: PilZ domain-containing protein [Candidatus Acidiferrales bacterium]